ncbi:MAG: garA 5 [Planctomycetaceae bacterium]|nr:garA 5 [Planctomycetaceae bacterium]
MDRTLVLECQSHNLPFSQIVLMSGTFVVGRLRRCGIYVPDPTVSRRHAEITISDHGAIVVDLESRNGTFIDETPTKSGPIRLGQDLRFGRVSFRLTSEADSDQEVESTIEAGGARVSILASLSATSLDSLTPAQQRVCDLLRTGLAEPEVAIRLKISRHTVHNHTREIYRILGVHSRVELLARLLSEPKNGTLDP